MQENAQLNVHLFPPLDMTETFFELTEPEEAAKKHLALRIGEWMVELHGTLRGGLSVEVDRTLDEVMDKVFYGGDVRSWMGTFAVVYLGMPETAMPFLNGDVGLKKKADKICEFVMEVGNFGHNRDMSYYNTKPYLVRKAMSMGRRIGDFANHVRIFPIDTLRFMPNIILNGLQSAANGE